MKLKGMVYTIVSAVLFGITPVFASFTYNMGSTPETVTFYRNLLAIPILLIVILMKRMTLKIPLKAVGNIAVIGIIGCGLTTLLLYKSYQYVGIGTATTLHFLYPVFVALICRFFYKDRLSLRKIIALVIAGAGIICFIDPSQISGFSGILLAVSSGLTYSFYMVGSEKRGLNDIDPYKVSFYIAVFVMIAMIIYNVPTRKIVFILPPKAFLYLFVISICTSFLAVALLQSGIKHLGASTAAIFCLFEPVTSLISGRLFLGEHISVQKAAGCILIIAAVSILVIKKSNSEISEAKS
ncbi:MAG: DMT family transporter [Bacillota bacterium]|nr:DMT family transporter [Bacillota bacterium]